ncbi:MAG: D-alanyl-D-alanine carboxypeptidase [Ruminococcus sp.]|nr:D-alanyl-D-alanine carboxypeptidase [Ruminococcus sp.]
MKKMRRIRSCKILSGITALAAMTALTFPSAGLTASAALKGDVDQDGTITIQDATMALTEYARYAASLPSELDAGQLERADVDEDGLVTITDATYILTYYARQAASLSSSWADILPESIVPDISISLTGLNSPYAALLDAQTGEVIADKNGYTTVYPASMTKIMTAILTIENFPDLNQYITVPSSIYNTIWAEGASTAGFQAGDYVPMMDMLYGMLLPSGCECCLAAAVIISGSEANFVELMNQKAAEIGMTGTHYANCTGLPNSNHYTTPYDMTLLLQYALENDIFRQVDTTSSYTAANGLYLTSTLFRPLMNTYGTTAVTGGAILGGKTGSTSAAGICLTSFAEICGREYILCTAKAPGSGQHIQDAVTVYNRLGSALS